MCDAALLSSFGHVPHYGLPMHGNAGSILARASYVLDLFGLCATLDAHGRQAQTRETACSLGH